MLSHLIPCSRSAFLGGAALVALLLAPALARADAAADARALAAAIEAAGCIITNANEGEIVTAAGLAGDDDAAFAALQMLIGNRQLRLDDASGTLTTGACAHHAGEEVAAEVLAERRAAVIARIAEAGCRVTPQSIDDVLRDTGMSEAEQVETIMGMAAEGLARFEMDGGSDQFILMTGPCAEGGEPEAAEAEGAEAEATEVHTPGAEASPAPPHDGETVEMALQLVVALRGTGCAATPSEAALLVTALGGEAAMSASVAALNDGGHLLAPRSPQGAVLLSEALCSAPDEGLGPALGLALRPSADPAPASRLGSARMLIAELRARQCLYSPANALRYLEHLQPDQPQAVLDRVAQTGLISVQGDGLAVSDLACSGDIPLVNNFLAVAFDGVKRKP